MYDLATIKSMNQEVAREARRKRNRPYVPIVAEEVLEFPPFPFPSVGDYNAPGWERTATNWFVDISGWGQVGEPALTIGEFRQELYDHAKANPTHGYAITETGQFQAYITAFQPKLKPERKKS